ncbi:MAG: hypothetical protein JNK63_02435 [Chthonomonas sp.]|nr:hypothetical protein [Chthonomonas sp.]
MAKFDMTIDDEMFPIYCTRCHKNIARAESDYYKGLCELCDTQVRDANQKAAVLQQQIQAAKDADALKRNRDHGLRQRGYIPASGACPYCNGGPLYFRQAKESRSDVRSVGCLGFLCCAWPLILLCLIPDRKGQKFFFCSNCGKEFAA